MAADKLVPDIKKDFFWNTLGSGIYAFSSVFMAFMAMRFAGADDGGIFGFGYSTFGQQMFIIAYFGVRPFHITDSARKYGYGDYRRQRIVTAGAALVFAAAFLGLMCLTGRYRPGKSFVILLLALIKIADGIADLYESECQRENLLWYGARALTCRVCLSVLVFSTVIVLTGDIALSALGSVAVQYIYIAVFRRKFADGGLLAADGKESGGGRAAGLFRETGLLFLSVFIDFYIFSASKYAIDFFMEDADSGVFNILFMPTSVIYLLANFIIRPYMTRLSEVRERGDAAGFRALAVRLLKAVAALGAVILLLSVLLGKPALWILETLLGKAYAGAFTSLYAAFVVIILGGCFYAATNLFYYILVIMRRQKTIFGLYVLCAAAASFISAFAVKGYGLNGAAASYAVCMGIETLLFAAAAYMSFRTGVETSAH